MRNRLGVRGRPSHAPSAGGLSAQQAGATLRALADLRDRLGVLQLLIHNALRGAADLGCEELIGRAHARRRERIC